MSAPITIRDATPDDAERLIPVLATLGYPSEPAIVRQRLTAFGSLDPSGRILVADDGSRILGFASLHNTPTLHRDTVVGRITGLAVLADTQGMGVGRMLVDAAERHFRALGLTRVEVTSGLTHMPAYDFYRHRGYVDQGVRFAKTLA